VSIEIHAVDGHELGDVSLAVRAAEQLNKHYPGHLWAVHIDSEDGGGMVYIRNLAFSSRYGYRLKLSRVQSDPDLLCVMRAGGEILERAKVKRGWWDGQVPEYVEGLLPQHQPFHGIVI
jgi:hypothetical protein